jgi:hypothetical protein
MLYLVQLVLQLVDDARGMHDSAGGLLRHESAGTECMMFLLCTLLLKVVLTRPMCLQCLMLYHLHYGAGGLFGRAGGGFA